ncbi:MAG: PD40 domain-containing protein [Rhodothermia bacterium]|nr:PD40 domain-containing protein [Rhodothermia bacterium]
MAPSIASFSGSRKRRIRRLVSVAAWLVSVVASVQAQVYSVDVRPPEVSYRVIQTDHFDLIYQSGYKLEAIQTGEVLESSLARSRELLGTRRKIKIPVVLNAFNDRSNGFVTPLPFKMEIEIPSLKGNRLSPRHPSWLDAVARHELVHAVHAEFDGGFGFLGLVRLFSPDLSRMMNLMVPAGMAEGVAVFLESEGPGRPGRLNHSLFQMQFRAAMMADRPWSLAQMLEPPRYAIPGDRFYHGGSYLYSYLFDYDAGDTFRRTQRFHNRFPFLGYGVSLWAGARKSPWALARDFRLDSRQVELERQLRLGDVTEPTTVSTAEGLVHRRPLWLNDHEVIAYLSGYHTVQGFYRIDVDTGGKKRVSAERITEDVHFRLSADRKVIVFSRYVRDPLVASERIAEVFRLRIGGGSSSRLSRRGRITAVAESPRGEVWGVVDSGTYSRLARLSGTIELPAVALPPRVNIKSLEWSPTGDTLAALVNRDAVQGIYLIYPDGDVWAAKPVVEWASGSVLDFSWLPDGRGLLFTSDLSGSANLYALSLDDNTVVRLTNARYGSFEGSVSPDGSRIALIDYQHEQWNLATMPFDFSAGERIAPAPYTHSVDSIEAVPDEFESEVVSRPYRPLRYLSPRQVFPIIDYTVTDTSPEDVDLGIGVGAAIAGADPLQRWSYSAVGWYQAEKLWGQFTLRSGASVVRPAVGVFRTPSTRIVRTSEGIRRVGKEEEGAAFGLALPVTLSSNVYSSSVSFGIAGQYSRARFFGRDGQPLTTYDERATVSPTLTAQFGTHASLRDIRFRRGLTFGGTLLHDVWSSTKSRTGTLAEARLFFPSIPGSGGSFSIVAGYLWQSEAAIYNLDFFLPRGLEDSFVPRGGRVKYGLDLLQPLFYVDDGFFLLPIFLKSIYAYGFAESVKSSENLSFDIDSVGGGLGFQFRVFYLLNFDLRFGAAYLPDSDSYEMVFR